MSACEPAVSRFGILQGLLEEKLGMGPDPQTHLDAFPLTRPLLVRPSPEPSGGRAFTGLTGQPRCLEERFWVGWSTGLPAIAITIPVFPLGRLGHCCQPLTPTSWPRGLLRAETRDGQKAFIPSASHGLPPSPPYPPSPPPRKAASSSLPLSFSVSLPLSPCLSHSVSHSGCRPVTASLDRA